MADAVGLCIQQLDLARCEVTKLDDRATARHNHQDPTNPTHIFGLGSNDLALVATHEHAPDPEGIAFLESVATLITVALERHASESQLRWAATHDPLTALPNRTMIHDHLDKLLQRREANENIHVVFIDLDEFNRVNGTSGHYIGDQLLVAVAKRLQSEMRDGDVAGRIAGDEFVVLSSSTSATAADELARRLIAHLSQPYDIDGHEIVIGASAGVAGASRDTTDAESLVAQADAAMYMAKADTAVSS